MKYSCIVLYACTHILLLYYFVQAMGVFVDFCQVGFSLESSLAKDNCFSSGFCWLLCQNVFQYVCSSVLGHLLENISTHVSLRDCADDNTNAILQQIIQHAWQLTVFLAHSVSAAFCSKVSCLCCRSLWCIMDMFSPLHVG